MPSRLLFSASATQISPLQDIQLAAALGSLRGGGDGFNPLGYTATQIEIALTKSLRLHSVVGSPGGSKLDLRYCRDY